MATIISHSPEETEAYAARMAGQALSGLVIGLTGDLGSGKTQFVKGFARGLGITARVHSPTFALLHIYSSGRLPLFHLDLYRLQSHDQIMAAGLGDYFEPAGISVVEWVERWQGAKPALFVHIRMESLNETDRRIWHDHTGA